MTLPTGGYNSVTASLAHTLAREGITNPQSGEPLSEAMILGIGGGLGAGYILWEFKAHDSATIVIGFLNRWNYGVEYISNACERLNVKVDIQETGSAKKAQANLDQALENHPAVIVWADKASLPYHQLPEHLIGHAIHVICVYGKEGDTYRIDDLASQTWQLSTAELATARAPIPSNKQRMMTLSPSGKVDLKKAVLSGIEDHIEHLSRSSDSFSLPVYEKWAKMMVHPQNKKGWHTVFKERTGLYTTLRTIHEAIRFDDTKGAGLRDMYADFLQEAQSVTGNDALADAVKAYRACADTWRDFSEIVLPNSIPAFAETKTLMHKRYASFKAGDMQSLSDAMHKLTEMEARYNKAGFPLDDAGVHELFEAMSAKLTAIYDAEVQALTTLKNAVG